MICHLCKKEHSETFCPQCGFKTALGASNTITKRGVTMDHDLLLKKAFELYDMKIKALEDRAEASEATMKNFEEKIGGAAEHTFVIANVSQELLLKKGVYTEEEFKAAVKAFVDQFRQVTEEGQGQGEAPPVD